MFNILDKLSCRCWEILFVGVAIAIATSPFALVLLATNGGGFEYKTDETEINLSGRTKELTYDNDRNLQELEAQLRSLSESNRELIETAKRKKVMSILKPEIAQVQTDLTESENKFKEVEQSQEQLNDFVKDAIAK